MSNQDKQKKNKIVFHKDMTLGEVLTLNPNTRAVLMGFGMHCFGCPISQMETLEEACMVHGVELDYLLQKLNEVNELPENEQSNVWTDNWGEF